MTSSMISKGMHQELISCYRAILGRRIVESTLGVPMDPCIIERGDNLLKSLGDLCCDLGPVDEEEDDDEK